MKKKSLKFLKFAGKSLRKMDFFARKTELTMNKEANYTTVLGGLFSSIMIALSILLFINFGSNMIYRQDPAVVYSEFFVTDPQRNYFSQNDYFFMFGVEDPNFSHFIDDSVYRAQAVHSIIDSTGYKSTNIILERCNESLLPQQSNIHDYFMNAPKASISNIFCVKDLDKYFIDGAFDSNSFSFIEITIQLCDNSTNTTICRPQEEINTIMQGTFAFYTMDYLIDPKNHDTPGSAIGRDYSTPISPGLTRITQRFISTTNIISDDGLIFSFDTTTMSYPTYNYDKENFIIDNKDSQNNVLMQFVLRKHHNELNHERTYKKLQDVLSDIGGFIQMIYLLFFTVSYPFISKKYYEKITNLIFNFEEIDPEKPVLKKKKLWGNSQTISKKVALQTLSKLADSQDNSKQSFDKSDFLKYVMTIKNKSPLITGIWEFFVGFFLPFRKKSNNKLKRLKAGQKAIEEKIDISYILEKFYEIDKLKMILFSPEQYHLFEYLSKPLILKNAQIDLSHSKDQKLYSGYETNLIGKTKRLYSSFKKIKQQNELTPIDRKLIDFLDDDLKNVLEVFFFILQK